MFHLYINFNTILNSTAFWNSEERKKLAIHFATATSFQTYLSLKLAQAPLFLLVTISKDPKP